MRFSLELLLGDRVFLVFFLFSFCVLRLVFCRVAAFCACARSVLSDFFSTIGHCAWRHFISFSNGEKETKQRKRLSTTGS
jgi:hypothetical protein